jgi:ferredoxin--NADP+ reductase
VYEDEFKKAAKKLIIATDDGSYGIKGFVTDALKEGLEKGEYDCVMAVGPMPMMRAVCALTKNYGVKTVVSMNPVMVDGTGMCGGCRLTVGGVTKYACVDGPEFDGHEIDWDEAMMRLGAYKAQEKEHACRLTGEKR